MSGGASRCYTGLHVAIPVLLYAMWVSDQPLGLFNIEFPRLGIHFLVLNAIGLYIFLSRLKFEVQLRIHYTD